MADIKNKAFIFDLDGTLLDSYGVILASLDVVLHQLNIEIPMDEVHEFIIKKSVNDLILTLSESHGIDPVHMRELYTEVSHAKKAEISTMPHALETLDGLKHLGCPLFVYTHRGTSTAPVLTNNRMDDCFLDIVTSVSGFARKPAPDALLYLIEKHHLSPESTYYVGDRPIDMECAKNACVPGILYLPEGSPAEESPYASITIHDLEELIPIARS